MVGESILSTVPEHYRPEQEQALQRMVARGGTESFQTVRLSKSGRPLQVSITLSPIRDVGGAIVGTAIIARDISEQVKLQERLMIADRMISVGTLAAGVAHGINNPLAAITVNLDLVLEDVRSIGGGSPSGRLKEMEKMASEARTAADRIRKIVRGLMTFSRTDEKRPAVVVDIKQVLELSIGMASNEIRQSARLVRDYGDTPLVFVDDSRLAQVFVNLLVNAAQAIGSDDAEANEIRLTTLTDETGRVVVEVHDTGKGISPSALGHLFTPFFTTKPFGLGPGLGLSICYNIVTEMSGEITARSRGERGATFSVALPASTRPPSDYSETPLDFTTWSSRDYLRE